MIQIIATRRAHGKGPPIFGVDHDDRAPQREPCSTTWSCGALIGFVGDLHGRFFHLLAAVATRQRVVGRRFNLVIQVGDFGAITRPEQIAGRVNGRRANAESTGRALNLPCFT